jgi:transposase
LKYPLDCAVARHDIDTMRQIALLTALGLCMAAPAGAETRLPQEDAFPLQFDFRFESRNVDQLRAIQTLLLPDFRSQQISSQYQQLDARLTANTLECFRKGQRVCSHARSDMLGAHTTVSEHMPESHRRYGDWSPKRLIDWAEKFGAATGQVITQVLCARRHPQQGYRSCLGILRLAKTYGDERLESACQRALLLGTHRYKSIESILKHGLDKQSVPEQTELPLPADHPNIRGSAYFH